ncbi:MAG TPA: diguanylate cyclase [Woeseiaceae bacterium]
MPSLPQPQSGASADSPYAAELQRGETRRRFEPRLESEYVRMRFVEMRSLIRVTCILGAVLSLFCLAGRTLQGHTGQGHLLALAVVLLASAGLAIIACSSRLDRLYLPVAGIVVPVRNALAAVLITRMAAHGQFETLMAMPLMVVGPFFFIGLAVRPASFAIAGAIASFMVSAAVFGLPLKLFVYTCAFLLVLTGASSVAALQLDERFRKSFLEGRLIAELAEHDALTGTKNRRVFDQHLAGLWRQAMDAQRTIAVLLVDVDHFKAYNDRYGHQAGDRALRRVAQALQANAGGSRGLLARYGGEEFVVVLDDVQAPQAVQVAERMRRAVAELAIEHRGGEGSRVTISVGVAALAPAPGRRPRGALQLADQALYDAKVRGRNRVELLEEEDYSLLVTGSFSKRTVAGPLPGAEGSGHLRARA